MISFEKGGSDLTKENILSLEDQLIEIDQEIRFLGEMRLTENIMILIT
jgi:hypothetical protein